MHDKVYNRLSTESKIGSRKICMDELVFLKFFLISMLTFVYYTFQCIWRIFSDNIKLHISQLRNYMQSIIVYKIPESGPFLEREPVLLDFC